MRTQNFQEIAQNAMNNAAETSRDKGLLETALTMTSFSMPSQADVMDYEITLLTEKQNQVIQHIEELVTEASERLSEMNAERDAILAEMEHYKEEGWQALRRKQIARDLYGRDSQQVEKHHAAFTFAHEMYDKARAQLPGIGVEMLEMEVLLSDMRDTLAGNTPSVAPSQTAETQQESADLPFTEQPAAATGEAISRERFNQILKGVNVISAIEGFTKQNAEDILYGIRNGYKRERMLAVDAIEGKVWESEDLDDATKELFAAAIEDHMIDVEDAILDAVEEQHAPSQRRINANIGYVRA